MKHVCHNYRSSSIARGCLAVLLVAGIVGLFADNGYAQNKKRFKNNSSSRGTAEKKPPPRAAIANPPTGPAPKAVAAKSDHDFGTVWAGPKLEYSFEIKNEGEKPLEIIRVKPSCGCTKAGTHPSVIEPGESGKFPFAVDSKKLRGRFSKSVLITTNDPYRPDMRLKLSGTCKRFVDVLPANAVFGKVAGDEPQERVLKITNNTEEPIAVSVDPAEQAPFKFEMVTKTEGKEFELHIKMIPPLSSGRHIARATITTTAEGLKTIPITATATVPDRLDIQPSQLTINPAVKGNRNPTKRPIRFTNYGKTPVKILDATCSDPKVKVTVNERTPGKAYMVNVELPAGFDPTQSGQQITLRTDDAKQPVIQIPISYRSNLPQRAQSKPKRPAEQMVGRSAPAFSTTTIDGKTVSNATLADNSATVLNFIAANCGYCKKQLPRVEKIRQQYEAKGVRFVNVVQTMRKRYATKEVVDVFNKTGAKLELAHDVSNGVGGAFKATSYPTMVVVGKTGKVEAVNTGNLGDLESRLKGQLDAVIAGKPVPSFAPKSAKAVPSKAAPKRQPQKSVIGSPAPAFSINTVGGKRLSSADFAKHPATILNFVAPNCGYCKKQVPRLEKIRQQFESKGVRFVNVVETMRKKFSTVEVVDTYKKLGSKLELAHDADNKVGGLFQARGFPTMVVVGKDGKVAAVNVGNVGDLEARMKGQLDAMVAGKPIPAAFATAPSPSKPSKPRQRPVELLVGKQAPAFAMDTVNGKNFGNADFASNSATVLNFVAPNCGYCKKQVPRVEPIRKQFESKGVRFVNVVQTMRKKYPTDEVVSIYGKLAKMEIAHDSENKVGGLFKATGFPTMVIVGKSGKVEAVNVGNMGDLEKRMAGQLGAIVAGKPVPAAFANAPSPAKPNKPRKRPVELLVGKPAPAFAADTIDGKNVGNADFASNSATVLNFVAPNCGFCKKQVPRVEPIRKQYESKGVRFVNVVQTMRKKYPTDEVVGIYGKLAKMEITHDPDNKIGGLYKATGFPTMVIIGKSGKVEAVNVGNMGDLEKRMKGQLDAIIAGKPLPKFASKAPTKNRRPAMDLVGKPAPSFFIDTLDGKRVDNPTFTKSAATVLNFVAPNCGYCKKAMPNVEKVRQAYEAKGVRFVNIALTMRKEYETAEVKKVFDGTGAKLELAHDPKNMVGRSFKAVSFPTMVVVDKKGNVAHVNIGAKKDLDTILKGQLDALIAGS